MPNVSESPPSPPQFGALSLLLLCHYEPLLLDDWSPMTSDQSTAQGLPGLSGAASLGLGELGSGTNVRRLIMLSAAGWGFLFLSGVDDSQSYTNVSRAHSSRSIMVPAPTPGAPVTSSSQPGGFPACRGICYRSAEPSTACCSSLACFAVMRGDTFRLVSHRSPLEPTLWPILVAASHASAWALASFDSRSLTGVILVVMARLLMRRPPQRWTNLVSELEIGLRFGRLVVPYWVPIWLLCCR